MSGTRPALRAAVETVGVDQLISGTDYAFDEEDTDTVVADFRAVVTDDDDRRRVASETARSLFDLRVRPVGPSLDRSGWGQLSEQPDH